MGRSSLALLTLAALAGAAVAQNRYCIGGNLERIGSGQRAVCQARLAQLRGSLDGNAAIDNWHVVLICDEAGWSEYAAFSSHDAAQVAGAAVDVNAATRTVYLRSSKLDTTESAVSAVQAEVQAAAPEQIAAR